MTTGGELVGVGEMVQLLDSPDLPVIDGQELTKLVDERLSGKIVLFEMFSDSETSDEYTLQIPKGTVLKINGIVPRQGGNYNLDVTKLNGEDLKLRMNSGLFEVVSQQVPGQKEPATVIRYLSESSGRSNIFRLIPLKGGVEPKQVTI